MYLSKIEVEKSGKTVSIFTPQRDQFQNRPYSASDPLFSLFQLWIWLCFVVAAKCEGWLQRGSPR